MPHMQHYTEAERRLGHLPVNADDIVVMVSDVLYDYLPPEGGICGKEAIDPIVAVLHNAVAE